MAIGEFEIIEKYFRPLTDDSQSSLSLKDDAARLTFPGDREIVVTSDAIVETVHFLADTPADLIARKALRTNLSDLAAKGAEPLAYLMTLGVPKGMPESWFADLAGGLEKDQSLFGLSLTGGDTVMSPDRIFLSITMFGTAGPSGMITRAGARAGDILYVTGTIGDSYLGLQEALKEIGADQWLKERYEIPQCRNVAVGALRDVASAAMDVSDGLLADLGHMMKASGLGACLETDKVPLSDQARDRLASGTCSLWDFMSGGDDYEILFTSASDDVSEQFAAAGVPVTAIGRMTEEPGLDLKDDKGESIEIPLDHRAGHDHFGNSQKER